MKTRERKCRFIAKTFSANQPLESSADGWSGSARLSVDHNNPSQTEGKMRWEHLVPILNEAEIYSWIAVWILYTPHWKEMRIRKSFIQSGGQMIWMMNLLMVHQCNPEGLMARFCTLVFGSVQGWCVGLSTTRKGWMFNINDNHTHTQSLPVMQEVVCSHLICVSFICGIIITASRRPLHGNK